MLTIRLAAILACATLAACAGKPAQPDAPDAGQAEQQPKAVVTKPGRRQPPLPAQELTQAILFKIMVAEVAMQRGQAHVAVPAYLELARETRDPRVAQRATELAWNARLVSAAIEAAGIWMQSDPGSQRARQALVALLVNQAQLKEALPHLENWVAADKTNAGQVFLQIASLLARHKDRAAVLGLMQALARSYGDVPEARLAVAQAAWGAGNAELALAEARAGLALRPDWELAALFLAQVLQQRSAAEAISYLGGYIKEHRQARDARLNYARLLVNEKRYDEARRQFEVLLKDFPDNADVTMAVALLAMQAGDYDSAETQLQRLFKLGYKDPNAVRMYLGQISEERKRFDEALKWYGEVTPGGQHITAQSRYAGVLAKQGRLGDARRHLQQVNPQNSQQRVQLAQAEATLLREASAYREAFEVLDRALVELPDSPELLYDHALAAEKVDRVDVLEANLRRVIKMRPDHAHAYNALGYTLADRNERLDEARQLIDTALKLAPEDPFIMDSMGWVLYRQGRGEEALTYLQRAYGLRPDPEIGAHLGEVLWAEGKRDEARKIWSDVLKAHPKNEILQNTIKRFLQASNPAQ